MWAERKRAIILDEIEKGKFNYADHFPGSKRSKLFGHVPKSLTIEQLLNVYLTKAEKQLEYSTYNDYTKSVKYHLIPSFGKVPVVNLTPLIIRQWIEKNNNLSLKRISNVLVPLRHVLEQALNDEIIPRNPLDKLVIKKLLPKVNAKRKEVDPFDYDETKIILSLTKGQYHNLLKFAFFTGLRSSELIALQWSHVDLKKGVVGS